MTTQIFSHCIYIPKKTMSDIEETLLKSDKKGPQSQLMYNRQALYHKNAPIYFITC